MSVDKGVALIGFSNPDRRSFELNEEVSVLVYDTAVTAELRQSHPVNPAEWASRPVGFRLLQNAARMFAALM